MIIVIITGERPIANVKTEKHQRETTGYLQREFSMGEGNAPKSAHTGLSLSSH